MKLLAIDTASANAGVALICESGLLGEYMICSDRTHSKRLLPMIDTLLRECETPLADIDVFAVTKGPGSFTGLRIGLATAKTFAQAGGKPIVGVSALEALAENLWGLPGKVCAVMDARKDRIYSALFEKGKRLKNDTAETIDSLLERLAGETVIFAGDGAIAHKEQILNSSAAFSLAPEALLTLRPAALAQAAFKRALNQEFDSCYALSAEYLRPSQAEREYLQKNHTNI